MFAKIKVAEKFGHKFVEEERTWVLGFLKCFVVSYLLNTM